MRSDSFTHCAILTAALLSTLALPGCIGNSSDGGVEGAEVANSHKDGSKLSADDRAAADFVLTKLQEHWLKGPDGWTTQYSLTNYFGEVLPGDPELKFRQYREFKFSIEPEPLTETHKLNGIDYRAGVPFEKTSRRSYRTVPTYEGPQGWSMWSEDWPSMLIAVERRNGKWLISDDNLWNGFLPKAADVPTGK
jgi:hypothetical protein